MGRRQAFTFVEFLIVVAIVSILASVTIPNWFVIQRRAQRAELASHLSGIQTAEQAFHLANGRYLAEPEFQPDATPSDTLRTWDRDTHFDRLGWSPDGLVRGSYKVALTDPEQDFQVIGICDVDGDGELASYTATATTQAALVTRRDIY